MPTKRRGPIRTQPEGAIVGDRSAGRPHWTASARAGQDRGMAHMRLMARLCWSLDAHRWAISASHIFAAALFVCGCVGFFWPALYVVSVTLFLLGSLLFLLNALGGALLEHGPST